MKLGRLFLEKSRVVFFSRRLYFEHFLANQSSQLNEVYINSSLEVPLVTENALNKKPCSLILFNKLLNNVLRT